MAGEYDIEVPTLQLNIYKQGRLVARIPCESVDEAAVIVAQWEDGDGIEYTLEDLSATHGAADVLAPEPEDLLVEDEYRIEGS